MGVKEVTFYVAICDRCGREAGLREYGEYSAMADAETAIDMTADTGWEQLPEDQHEGRRLLCPDCWTWTDDGEKVEREKGEAGAAAVQPGN